MINPFDKPGFPNSGFNKPDFYDPSKAPKSEYQMVYDICTFSAQMEDGQIGDQVEVEYEINRAGILYSKAIEYLKPLAVQHGREKEWKDAEKRMAETSRSGIKFLFGFMSMCIGGTFDEGFKMNQFSVPASASKLFNAFGVIAKEKFAETEVKYVVNATGSIGLKVSGEVNPIRGSVKFEMITVKYMNKTVSIYSDDKYQGEERLAKYLQPKDSTKVKIVQLNQE